MDDFPPYVPPRKAISLLLSIDEMYQGVHIRREGGSIVDKRWLYDPALSSEDEVIAVMRDIPPKAPYNLIVFWSHRPMWDGYKIS